MRLQGAEQTEENGFNWSNHTTDTNDAVRHFLIHCQMAHTLRYVKIRTNYRVELDVA